jgi:PadR family transcriptional regulator PadR
MTIMRMTYPTACVLQALANGKVFGMDIIEHTGLPGGTVYPILRRFERGGLVESAWETPAEAHGNRRPQRRNYRLTAEGRAALAEARQRYRQHVEVFGTPDPDTRPAS